MKHQKGLLVAGAGMIVVQVLVQFFATNKIVVDGAMWFSLIFLLALNFLANYIVSKDSDPKKFVTRFMGSLGLRFVLSIFYVLAMKYMFEGNFKAHAVHFMMVYFILMIVETATLFSRVKSNG